MMNKIKNTITEYNMIKKGDTVAVCLSGGADSMALFHFLCNEKENLQINLFAIHINHGLRKESEDEEKFIKEYCENKNIKCYIHKAFMNDEKKPQGLSVETWARKVRYDYFHKIQNETNCILATAHTLSDNSETVLFNLARGSNIKGLKGISPVRDGIIRPLINITRAEVENYCKENDVFYVNDLTNYETIYSRNKIRLEVIPVLKQINPAFENGINNFTKEMDETNTFLTQLSDNLYNKSIKEDYFLIEEILKADKVIIKNFLRNILENLDCLSYENIQSIYNAIIKNTRYKKQLKTSLFCHIKDGKLFFKEKIDIKKNTQEKTVVFDEIIQFNDKKFIFTIINKEDIESFEKSNKNTFNYYVNYDKINSKLKLRTRRENDKITLKKRKVTKPIKKLFIEDKIPLEKRESFTILASCEDVIWIDKYEENLKYTLQEDAKEVLVISIV